MAKVKFATDNLVFGELLKIRSNRFIHETTIVVTDMGAFKVFVAGVINKSNGNAVLTCENEHSGNTSYAIATHAEVIFGKPLLETRISILPVVDGKVDISGVKRILKFTQDRTPTKEERDMELAIMNLKGGE